MESLKLMSMNCRGLGDFSKRKDVFEYLRSKDASIYCLQDTHFTEKNEKIIRGQWGYECISSFGISDSRSVSISFRNNFEYHVKDIDKDNEGNYLIVNLEIAKMHKITLVNIYGPNEDKPEFYKNIKEKILDIQQEFIILCGDMNLVLNFELDCDTYTRHNNKKSCEEVHNIMEVLCLKDPLK